MLKKNFDTAYHGLSRAPFGLYVHAAWFFGYDYRYEGYKKFLDGITQLDDVWIVPIQAGIAYRKAPLTNDEILRKVPVLFYEPTLKNYIGLWEGEIAIEGFATMYVFFKQNLINLTVK